MPGEGAAAGPLALATPQPEWQPEAPWGAQVSSYALDDGERLLLFDPLGVPDELVELAREREPAIVLTSPWHERGTQDLVERLAGGFDVHYFGVGDRLTIGVEAFLGREANDLVLWVEGRRALVTGDTLADFGGGLEIVPGWWLPAGVTREAMIERLRALLELPVELVLPAHGEPAQRDALERALA